MMVVEVAVAIFGFLKPKKRRRGRGGEEDSKPSISMMMGVAGLVVDVVAVVGWTTHFMMTPLEGVSCPWGSTPQAFSVSGSEGSGSVGAVVREGSGSGRVGSMQ